MSNLQATKILSSFEPAVLCDEGQVSGERKGCRTEQFSGVCAFKILWKEVAATAELIQADAIGPYAEMASIIL